MSENWVKAVLASELPPGQMIGVEIGGRAICVYNADGTYCATSNICTHAFAFLSDGYFDGEVVECPLHAGMFDARTGAGQGPPVEENLQTFTVRVVGDEVQVDLG
jgi:nitrite reductase/ring-hydroxylating ferredoxin subunit